MTLEQSYKAGQDFGVSLHNHWFNANSTGASHVSQNPGRPLQEIVQGHSDNGISA